MVFYIAVFIVLIGLGITEAMTNNKKVVFISGSLLGLMAGLRHYTGYDFTSYEQYFDEVHSFSQLFDGSIRLEPGYLFLVALFRTLGFNYYTFVLFFSLISLILLTIFLYKYVSYPSFVMVYYYARYFLARDMGQVRASLVAIVLLFAIPYIQKKEPLKFLAIIIAASMFHYSAILFLGIYVLHYILKDITFKKAFILMALAIVMGFIIQNPSLFISVIPESYKNYFTSPSHASGAWLEYPILWMQILIFIGSVYFIRKDQSDEKGWYNILATAYLIAILALLATGRLETVGGRVSTMFATTEILLVPYLFQNITRYKMINIIGFVGFSTVVFILIFIISGMYNQYIPYQTIF
ncbi:EpsG family protein [Marinilactibacillus sp. GCM10026970]|uniref:EpsG family protein n=1 Tax=Marinilactibacillus sp. GCM10026970 TaxID=3252642 RepID=UPI003610DA64